MPSVKSPTPAPALNGNRVRRSPGLLARAGITPGNLTRLVRRVTSREQIVSFLKNLAVVIPLTILIWVYAERENDTKLSQTIPFEVVSADQSRVVDVIGMDERSVVADLLGSRSRLDFVRDLLQPRDGRSPIRITVESSLQPGRQHTLRIQQLIDKDPIFIQGGVTVSNTSPATLTVFVDKVVSRDVPVRVPPSLTSIESVVFDPPAVRVSDAETKILQAEKEGSLYAYADMERLASTRVPGAHTEKGVKLLRLGNDAHRTLLPSEVSVSFNVREANVAYTFRSMAVFVLAPQNIQAQYKIDYDPILNNVTVVGPPQKIEMLKRDDFQPKPRAVLELTRDDVTNVKPKTVRFIDLPEGVTVDEASARREVAFKLNERGAGE